MRPTFNVLDSMLNFMKDSKDSVFVVGRFKICAVKVERAYNLKIFSAVIKAPSRNCFSIKFMVFEAHIIKWSIIWFTVIDKGNFTAFKFGVRSEQFRKV